MTRLLASLLVAAAASGCGGWTGYDPAPPRAACPPGRHTSAGHCCVEGAEWVPARGECICLAADGCPEEPAEAEAAPGPADAAPPAAIAEAPTEEPSPEPEVEEPADGTAGPSGEAPPPSAEATVASGCVPGAARPATTGGGCCRDGSYWAPAKRACRPLPRCPRGSVAAAGRCVTVGAPGNWVAIAPGTFVMGSPADEGHRFEDERQHRVTLSRWLLLRATEVTQADFEAALGYNPSRFSSCGDDCPAERVSWNEAAAYCNALSRAEGLESCYECEGSGREARCRGGPTSPYLCAGYRLPTETEWEYAVRAGSTGERYGEPLQALAWFRGNSLGRAHPVGELRANAWGLHDMLGNVDEWCHDWYAPYPTGEATDPYGPPTGRIRVLRGGSWIINEGRVRAAYRYRGDPALRVGYVGLRPARSVHQTPPATD